MASVREQINIGTTARCVWAALTTAEGWTSWYADEARVDARVGGRVVLVSEGDDGEPLEEVGILHIVRPTSRLEIRFDSTARAPTAGTRLRFNIARDGEETRVGLVQSGGVLDDDALRESVQKTWRQALRALRDHLED